jgi:hypothetical protein
MGSLYLYLTQRKVSTYCRLKSIGDAVLRTIFEAKGDKASKRRTLHECYSSRNVTREIKLKNMRWTPLTERIEKKDC